MKKIIFIMSVLFFPALGGAQVGIGTVNPERELHVSGSTNATIRIESFSTANNLLNDGLFLAPVYVDKKGNLTLKPSENGITSIKIIDANTTFASQVVVTNPIGTTNTITNIYSYNFTLNSPASIEIRYSMSYRVFETYSGTTGVRIFDGQSRQIRNYFTVNTDPNPHGQISQVYYNMTTSGSSGIFYNNGFGYIDLPAGNHTLYFHADVAGSTNNQAVVVFGGSESLLRLRFY